MGDGDGPPEGCLRYRRGRVGECVYEESGVNRIIIKGPWCPINDPLPEGVTAPVEVVVVEEPKQMELAL